MNIKGIGNDITNAYSQMESSKSTENKFNNIFEAALDKKNDQELKDACQEFEAYYVQQLFKEMRKTIPDGGLFENSNEGKIYKDMLDEKYSGIISEGSGTGIADALYKQLSPQINKKTL